MLFVKLKVLHTHEIMEIWCSFLGRLKKWEYLLYDPTIFEAFYTNFISNAIKYRTSLKERQLFTI